MKKKALLTIAMIAAIALIGCGSNASNDNKEKSGTDNQPTITEEVKDASSQDDNDFDGFYEEEEITSAPDEEYPYVVENELIRVTVEKGFYVPIDEEFDGREEAYQEEAKVLFIEPSEVEVSTNAEISVGFGISDDGEKTYKEISQQYYENLSGHYEDITIEEDVVLGEKIPSISDELIDVQADQIVLNYDDGTNTDFFVFEKDGHVYRMIISSVPGSEEIVSDMVKAFELK